MKKQQFPFLVSLLLVAILALSGCGEAADTRHARPNGVSSPSFTSESNPVPSDEATSSAGVVSVAEAPEAPETSETSAPAEPATYTKGAIVDGVYRNPWAGLNYTLTADLPEGTRAEYASYENATTECGLLVSDTQTGRQLAVIFETVPELSATMTATEYINILVRQIVPAYRAQGITVAAEGPFSITIAGQTYSATKISLNGGVAYQYYCSRRIDDRIVTIVSTESDDATARSVLAAFKAN